MRFIEDVSLVGRRVFIRADLNVPLDSSGSIADETRIAASLETIKFALAQGAKVILASHLGRPEGKRNPKYSLRPIAARLRELLGVPVTLAQDCVGPEVEEQARRLPARQVLLLENLRFHAEEEANDDHFAHALARLCDVYINDAFATAHRKHASTFGMVRLVPIRAGGFTLKRELGFFARAFDRAEEPLLAIFGGAKVSTKIDAIRYVSRRADIICIGGAMATTFLAAKGLPVGVSLYEPDFTKTAETILDELRGSRCELLLPIDVVVAPELRSGVPTRIVPVTGILPNEGVFDIGPETRSLFANAVAKAKTIIWNGPVGAFETEEFSAGTYALIDALEKSSATRVVGGGDTDLALHRRNAYEKMTFVSTAGGAFLKLLEGKTLPAVAALEA